MLDITVHLQHPGWKTLLRPYKKTVHVACEAALAAAKLRRAEMSVVLADDKFIQEMNHTYRGKNKATNVLSFSSCHAELVSAPTTQKTQTENVEPWVPKQVRDDSIGDLILALETIKREAKEQHKKPKDHAMHLLVHGTLHLLGYDHERKKDAARMEQLEINILETLGIANPYL